MKDNVVQFPDWRGYIQKGDRNQTLATAHNAILMLDNVPALAGMCAWDELACRPVLMRAPPAPRNTPPLPGPYPRPWALGDVVQVTAFLQVTETSSFKSGLVEEAMVACASARRFHPIRAYVDALAWDGRPRLDMWMCATFDAPDTPYVRAVAAATLIGAVRRIRQPGCKLDTMPVWSSRMQGIGKSQVARALFEPWVSDYLPSDLADKDAAQAMQGVWAVEMAELDQLIRADAETVKAFLSRQVDRYRPPHGRVILEFPRQAVLIGTSNRFDYLRDTTGNRRFWPVECRTADPEWVRLNRDQLWAEAAARETLGEPHWLPPDLQPDAEAQQAANALEDTWDDAIMAWLTRQDLPLEITTYAVLTDALGIPRERQDRRAMLRCVDRLRVLGWKQVMTTKTTGKSRRVWIRKEP